VNYNLALDLEALRFVLTHFILNLDPHETFKVKV
jgi:hypothetical protein